MVGAFDIAKCGVARAQRLAAEQSVSVNFTVAEGDGDGFALSRAALDSMATFFIQFADPALRKRLFGHTAQSLQPGGLLLLQQGDTPPANWRSAPPGRRLSRTLTPAKCCAARLQTLAA